LTLHNLCSWNAPLTTQKLSHLSHMYM